MAEMSKYDQALAKYNTDLNDEAIKATVAKIIEEKVPQNDTVEVKKFLFGSIELTSLKPTDNDQYILNFTKKHTKIHKKKQFYKSMTKMSFVR